MDRRGQTNHRRSLGFATMDQIATESVFQLHIPVAYSLFKACHLPYDIAAPAGMIGASNFLDLAVAVAISLFGLQSGAALATTVGVLIGMIQA